MVDWNPIVDFVNILVGFLPYLFLGILGGVVGLFMNGTCDNGCGIVIVIKRCVVSAFVSCLAFFLASELALTDNYKMLLVGVSGFVSLDILPLLREYTLKFFEGWAKGEKGTPLNKRIGNV